MLEPRRTEPSSETIAEPPQAVPPTRRSTRARSTVLACAGVALRSTLRLVVLGGVLAVVACVLAVIAFRSIDPPGSMLIWSQRQGGQTIDQRWVPLSKISPALVRAVIISEDNQFCRHWGVDVRELKTTLKRAERLGQEPARGASTISMQVTKNLLLWPGKSYVRKAFELPLTVLVELVWPKRRIMEVYLNIAEWGPGVFGAEAAAQHHFGKSASRISDAEATLLAVALPNPFTRVAGKPSPNLRRVADVIERRTKQIGRRAVCVLGVEPVNRPASSLRRLQRDIAAVTVVD